MNKDSTLIFEAYEDMPPQCPQHLLEEGMSHQLHAWVMGVAIPKIKEMVKKNPKTVIAAGGLVALLAMKFGMDPDTAQQAVDGILTDPEWSNAVKELKYAGFTENQIVDILPYIEDSSDESSFYTAAKEYMSNNPDVHGPEGHSQLAADFMDDMKKSGDSHSNYPDNKLHDPDSLHQRHLPHSKSGVPSRRYINPDADF